MSVDLMVRGYWSLEIHNGSRRLGFTRADEIYGVYWIKGIKYQRAKPTTQELTRTHGDKRKYNEDKIALLLLIRKLRIYDTMTHLIHDLKHAMRL